MANHNPVNHPLRPLYRALAGLTGVYLAVFGVVGFVVTGGDGLFGESTHRILGQGGNLAWSIASLILGAVTLLAVVLGRNIDIAVDTYLGWGLLILGTFELAVSRTDLVLFNFTVSTVVVTYIVGLALILAGLYGKVTTEKATPERADRQRQAV